MLPWTQLVIVLAVVAVTVALVAALLAVRRAAERAERLLALLEQRVPPLAGELEGLVGDLRALARDARGGLARVSAVSDGLGRALGAVAGFARAGQLVGVAAGLKAGFDVFLHRLRRQRGDEHG